MSRIEPLRVDAGDIQLHAEVAGAGPVTLLALHGVPGADHTLLRPWLDPLGERFRLVYHDHRAHGRSGGREGVDEVDLAALVRDVEQVRAAARTGRTVLFGHSFGAAVAQEYAIAHPDRVAGLVLCTAVPAYDDWPGVIARAQERADARQRAALDEYLAGPIGSDETLGRLLLDLLPLYRADRSRERMARMLQGVRYCAAASNRINAAVLPAFSSIGRMRGVDAPVLLLSGGQDWSCPPEQCGRLEREVAEVESHVFERSGHFPFEEEPLAFIELVSGWLARRCG